MKVALINKNPAVSRLITLSLNKIGTEYSEFEDLNGFDDAQFDFIIIDSDVDSSELATDKKVMYLASRGESKPEFATLMLEKPFLPTEFISVFEQNIPKDEPVAEHGESEQGESDFGDFSDEAINFDEMSGFKLPDIDTNLENFADLDKELLESGIDSPSEEISQSDLQEENEVSDMESLEELEDLQELASEDLADESVDEETSEAISDAHESEESKDGDLAELSALVDEIENMPEESEADEELNKNLDDIISQNDVAGLIDGEKADGELDEIDQSKFELSEIDSLDEELNSEETDEENKNLDDAELDTTNLEQEELNIDELAKFDDEDSLENEINLEDEPKDEENLDEISEADEEQIQVDDEKVEEDIEEEALDEISSEELENLEPSESKNASSEMPEEELEDMSEPEAKEDLGLVDETFEEENAQEEEDAQEESKDAAPSELNFDAASIDDIDESTMLAAFGLKDMPKTSSKNDAKEDYKEELTKKITKHVHESLNESSLRDVLKDMNIKINISFEEK
ncbi:Highly acidic protein [Campylobacter concisus]|uniref:Highly acidic protein n=1 Tax=Campylobacter concisus TaxID=199 RepID=A0A7S9RQJ4_9BACT|nr:Highly acidic protein [Campylobacter concisus]QPH96101.1 Highly acidic protein [Campylobacter concisus]